MALDKTLCEVERVCHLRGLRRTLRVWKKMRDL